MGRTTFMGNSETPRNDKTPQKTQYSIIVYSAITSLIQIISKCCDFAALVRFTMGFANDFHDGDSCVALDFSKNTGFFVVSPPGCPLCAAERSAKGDNDRGPCERRGSRCRSDTEVRLPSAPPPPSLNSRYCSSLSS